MLLINQYEILYIINIKD